MKYIAIGADHAGFKLKEAVKESLAERGCVVEDVGCHDTTSVDYPEFAKNVTDIVSKDPKIKGVLICGTGIGMSIAANKVKGIRAALCHNEFEAQMSRNHNDANIICLGARSIEKNLALRLVNKFLRSQFEGERHLRRLDKIKDMEC